MSKHTKCRCGQKQTKGICKNCSRVKMVILLKHGFSVYKENGHNPVRYNYVKTNRHTTERIIMDMIRRLVVEQRIMQQAISVIHFYDNHTNTLIQDFK